MAPVSLPLLAVVLAAFTVEAALGFGATVVTVALGSFLLPLDVLLPAFVPLNLVLSSYLVVRYRRDVSWRVLLRKVVPLMALGLPLGIAAFRHLEPGLLVRAFGVFVVALSVLELVRARGGAPVAGSRPLATAPGAALLILGGVVHGAFATGGPMAVYVAGRELPDKASFRATLAVLWMVLNVVLVAGYLTGGQLTTATLSLSGPLGLSLLLGLGLGEWAHRRVPAGAFRLAVFALLLCAGALLAGRG